MRYFLYLLKNVVDIDVYRKKDLNLVCNLHIKTNKKYIKKIKKKFSKDEYKKN